MHRLDQKTFSSIIEHTPLVSIDLIIKDKNDEVLLGKRSNEPAKGYWFVPGGRIFKNETITNAFSRIFYDEIGQKISISNAKLLDAYEHFYPNSFCNENVNTHYVVLAYKVNYDFNMNALPSAQHAAYKKFSIKQLLQDNEVHPYVKLYFKENK